MFFVFFILWVEVLFAKRFEGLIWLQERAKWAKCNIIFSTKTPWACIKSWLFRSKINWNFTWNVPKFSNLAVKFGKAYETALHYIQKGQKFQLGYQIVCNCLLFFSNTNDSRIHWDTLYQKDKLVFSFQNGCYKRCRLQAFYVDPKELLCPIST